MSDKKSITDQEAYEIIEDVIDTLCEVGNGVTDKDLLIAQGNLFLFRDSWLKQKLNNKSIHILPPDSSNMEFIPIRLDLSPELGKK
jgi:hypothetical protein